MTFFIMFNSSREWVEQNSKRAIGSCQSFFRKFVSEKTERLYAYPSEIRKMTYTTNTTESFHSALRKVTNRKAASPNATAVVSGTFVSFR